MDRQEFEKQAGEAGLSRIAPQLWESALPAVGFTLSPEGDPRPVGTSKLGGSPDLPASFAWPANEIDFLLQINLADIRNYELQGLLPSEGMLTFFYDMDNEPWGMDADDRDGFCVVYTPANIPLEPREVPEPEYAPGDCPIRFHPLLTLPHCESFAYESLIASLELTEKEDNAAADFPDEFEKSQFPSEEPSNHHLLGHAANIQNDMAPEVCNLLGGNADEWMLLLQFDSDRTPKMMWADGGKLYYWIRKQDLADRKFDRIWVFLQSH